MATDLYLLGDICRLCCSRKETVFPIFEESEDNLGIILKDVLPKINIIKNDSKPQQVCFDCRSKLQMFSDFLRQCLDSDCKFNSFLEDADCSESEDVLFVLKDGELKAQKVSRWIEIIDDSVEFDENTRIPSKKLTLIENDQSLFTSEQLNTEHRNDFMNVPLKIELVSDGILSKTLPVNKKEEFDLENRRNLQLSEQAVKEKNAVCAEDGLSKNSVNSIGRSITIEESIHGEQSCKELNNVCRAVKISAESTLWPDIIGAEEEIVTINEVSSEGLKKNCIICKICGRQFKKRTRLNAHMSQHTGIRSHRCSICNKTYAMKHDLNKHMRIHSKTFACHICDRPFTSKMLLKRHCSIHTGVKPVQCEICGKLLSSKQYLKLHTKGHLSVNGNKSYLCISCPTAFKDSWSLREHYDKIHSTDPPEKFHCKICDKKFTWRTNYNRHVRQHNL